VRVAGARVHSLFEEHARMVYGLCRTLLRDAREADDATQSAFVSAYRALLGGTQPREPAAWLATIARNECAARARARMREPLPLAETQIPHTPGPEAELERLNTVDELRAAIAGLPEKQREAVVLRDLYGLRYDEVGAALGMSVASVESLLFRARRRLRCSLKPLATGVLTVPLAVREGIAQAIPGFGTAAAPGGIGVSAAGAGLLAKLAGGPAAAKLAAGIAAAVAAGSVAMAKVEHPSRQSANRRRSVPRGGRVTGACSHSASPGERRCRAQAAASGGSGALDRTRGAEAGRRRAERRDRGIPAGLGNQHADALVLERRPLRRAAGPGTAAADTGRCDGGRARSREHRSRQRERGRAKRPVGQSRRGRRRSRDRDLPRGPGLGRRRWPCRRLGRRCRGRRRRHDGIPVLRLRRERRGIG
jgi:RNA polymerase sigma factor (sigma-70 family)